MRLGKALGIDGVTANPDALPGGNGHTIVADMRNQALGMQDVYLGGNADSGLGVSALARGLSFVGQYPPLRRYACLKSRQIYLSVDQSATGLAVPRDKRFSHYLHFAIASAGKVIRDEMCGLKYQVRLEAHSLDLERGQIIVRSDRRYRDHLPGNAPVRSSQSASRATRIGNPTSVIII